MGRAKIIKHHSSHHRRPRYPAPPPAARGFRCLGRAPRDSSVLSGALDNPPAEFLGSRPLQTPQALAGASEILQKQPERFLQYLAAMGQHQELKIENKNWEIATYMKDAQA